MAAANRGNATVAKKLRHEEVERETWEYHCREEIEINAAVKKSSANLGVAIDCNVCSGKVALAPPGGRRGGCSSNQGLLVPPRGSSPFPAPAAGKPALVPGFRVGDSGFRFRGVGFRVQGLGFRVWGALVLGLGSRG